MTLTCSEILSEQIQEKKTKKISAQKDVSYEIYKHQLCRIFIKAKRLCSQYITHTLAILVSTFRLNPREIVKMSLNKIRIFDLSKCLSFHTTCTLTKSIGQSSSLT